MARATMPTLVQKSADWDTHFGKVLAVQVPPDPRYYWEPNNALVLVDEGDIGTRTYLLDPPTPGMIVALLALAQSNRPFAFFTLPNSNYIPSLVY